MVSDIICKEQNFGLLLLADNFLIGISCHVIIDDNYSVLTDFCELSQWSELSM